METKLPLIVIAGPTASGKTELAIQLAEKFDGEIICADSRTVYKGMDVGTAKPTAEEQARVPHWGLDLAAPSERFTAADFKEYVLVKIKDIRERGKVPFLVGGTGLYIDSVVFDYEFGSEPDPKEREKLETWSAETLYEYCIKNNIQLPENEKNKRHLIRSIEQKSINTKRRHEPIDNTIIVGITTNKATLLTRIEARTEQLFANGVVQEATALGNKYGWQSEAMTANIYPLIYRYLNSQLSLDDLKQKFITLDWRLAKRQLTWLRRNPYIIWLGLEDARNYLFNILANEQKS